MKYIVDFLLSTIMRKGKEDEKVRGEAKAKLQMIANQTIFHLRSGKADI